MKTTKALDYTENGKWKNIFALFCRGSWVADKLHTNGGYYLFLSKSSRDHFQFLNNEAQKQYTQYTDPAKSYCFPPSFRLLRLESTASGWEWRIGSNGWDWALRLDDPCPQCGKETLFTRAGDYPFFQWYECSSCDYNQRNHCPEYED